MPANKVAPSGLPRQIGPWKILDELGHGGNAVVYRAVRDDAREPIALKVVRTWHLSREPYQRFVQEIKFLQERQSFDGLLPLIAAHLPDSPSTHDRPWLAMPIAVPIATSLVESSLPEVVGAVARVADTLSRLKEIGVAHRDIKPGNLYELSGEWLIGDFGLVALPDTNGLTKRGQSLGPVHFMAYEMLADAASADPYPADVYSLGKTLWVLATGVKFPPDGHQPAGTTGFQVADFRSYRRADALDEEIDSMTRIHPGQRPSMRQVAEDLLAWQEMASRPTSIDLSTVRARLRRKLRHTLSEQDLREHQKELAYAAIRRMQELTKPLSDELKSVYQRAQIDLQSDKMTQTVLKTQAVYGGAVVVFRWQRCTIVAPKAQTGSIALKMGRSVELLDSGELVIRLMLHVGPQGVMGSVFNWMSSPVSAQVGTVQAQKMIEDAIQELANTLPQAVEVFAESWPDEDAGS
ncbi:MAG: serine/threonine protein kinase [Candidatus Dormibacteria bacterium]